MSGTRSPLPQDPECPDDSPNDRSSRQHEEMERNLLLQHPSFLLHDLILAAKLDDVSALEALRAGIQEPVAGTGSAMGGLRRGGGMRRRARQRSRYTAVPTEVCHLGDLEDSEGWTPLHTACECRSEAAVAYLLAAGCSPNKPAHDRHYGVTPMHMACLGGYAGILDIMIAAGGTLLSPAAANGFIPVDMASHSSFPSVELIEVIEKHSGICISYSEIDDWEFGPQLLSRSFYTLQYDKHTRHYSVAREEELRRAMFGVGQPEWALFSTDETMAVWSTEELPSTFVEEGGVAVEVSCSESTVDTGLSDSFSEIMTQREEYMADFDHACNILDTEQVAERDCQQKSSDEEVEGGPVPPSQANNHTSSVPPAIMMPPPTTTIPAKQARFAPGTDSPAGSQVRLKRFQRIHTKARFSRLPLSDITPPQPMTPTKKGTFKKPPTPHPSLSKREHIVKKLEELQLDSKAPLDKENKPNSIVKLDFSSKLQPQGNRYRRMPPT